MNKLNIEQITGNTLRVGVVLACVLTVTGGVIYLWQTPAHSDLLPSLTSGSFSGAALYLRSISGIVPHLLAGEGAAIVQLGVLTLIATPIMRVVLSLILFFIQKDKIYVLITLTVLLIIVSNMIFGIH